MIKISVCIGSSCHIKGSRQVVEQLQYLISENKLGDKVELGIRPEHLVPVDHPDAQSRLSGIVQVAEHLGSESFVYMDVDGEDFTVKAASEIPVDTSDSLEVGIPAEACYLFDQQEKAFRRTAKYNRT